MFKFDFIDSAASGYRFVVMEHQRIYNLALVPFAVKLVCFAIITLFGLEGDILRQGLVLVPSYFVDGWMIAQILRLAMLGEYGTSMMSGDAVHDKARYLTRKKALLSSMVMFVLIKLLTTLAAGGSIQAEGYVEQAKATNTPDIFSYLSGVVFILAAFWAFRLVWVYIPLALGQPIGQFLKSIQGFKTSLYMMGTWVLCAIPIAVLLLMLSQILGTIFGLSEGGDVPLMYKYTVIIFQSGLELVTSIVASVAIAYTVANIVSVKNKR